MHRVYIHVSRYSGHWFVQYLEEDLKTSAHGSKIDRYATFDVIAHIMSRIHVEPEQRRNFDDARWGIQACFIRLTDEQYQKLKGGQIT
jgi:hypothetical protein